jgi:hypothetical protein
MKWRTYLSRTGGPVISILLHVVVIYVLLHVVAFRTKAPEPVIQEIAWEAPTDLTLDDLAPELKPPEESTAATDPNPVEPLAPEALQQLAQQAVDVTPEAAVELPEALPNVSPLKIWKLGGDAGSQTALQSRYGDRAQRNGLLGSYFNRIDFTGPTVMRIDETLNKQWELESPWPEHVRADLFSVIWTGRIVPRRSGRYTLYLQSDDGARLWINGKLVLDQYKERQRQEDTVELDLLVGVSYDIKYAFCEVFAHAISRLEWSCAEAGVERQLIPTDCLWADGASTRELLQWNEATGMGKYPNRDRMRNPAQVDDVAWSHLVDYPSLSEAALQRLQLTELAPDFRRYQQNGKAPRWVTLPSAWQDAVERVEQKPDPGEVVVEIQDS